MEARVPPAHGTARGPRWNRDRSARTAGHKNPLHYALIDKSNVVCRTHLGSALAVRDYCFDSARYIFGDAVGDQHSDELLRFIRAAGPVGVSRTEIRDLFGRNKSKHGTQRCLDRLMDLPLVSKAFDATRSGRPSEVWTAASTN